MSDLLTPLRHCSDRLQWVGRLRDISEAMVDVVAPQHALIAEERLDDTIDWTLVPDFPDLAITDGAHRDIAGRLDVPSKYWQRIVRSFPGLAATTHNTLAAASDATALYRLLRNGDQYVLRAQLSDRYGVFDNFSVLQAVGEGLTAAGQSLEDAKIDVDLTSDRFRMRIVLPSVEAIAADLLDGYRSPFNPGGAVPPVVWAGVEIGNSETGGGAFYIVPRAEFLICTNGLTRTKDAIRKVHLGERLDEGTVDWSETTRRLSVELLASKVADAVSRFASVEYLESMLADARRSKGIEAGADTIERVSVAHQLSEVETKSVMDMFLRGGDPTLFGVGQAVTAAAQVVTESDRQAEMEAMFFEIVNGPEARV
jgi:hypothetical protein